MKLITETSLEAADVQLDSLDSAFRKATMNMALATLCSQKALEQLPADVSKDQVAFIVATHFGEVHATLEFLSTYHDTQTPRPILFQNSLHNSTLGFASIHLGLTGPAMTVSCDRETETAAVNLAETLLQLTPFVLICFIDNIPQPLVPHYLANFPFLKKHLNRASCRLLARA